MTYGSKLPKKQAVIILSLLAVIIMVISLETMIHIKDADLFDAWYESYEVEHLRVSEAEAFQVYVTAQLSIYFFRVIVPMILGVHTYFAYVKLRVNKLFVFIWTVLLIGALAYRVAHKDFDSIFFYINIFGYSGAVLGIWTLIPIINGDE